MGKLVSSASRFGNPCAPSKAQLMNLRLSSGRFSNPSCRVFAPLASHGPRRATDRCIFTLGLGMSSSYFGLALEKSR